MTEMFHLYYREVNMAKLKLASRRELNKDMMLMQTLCESDSQRAMSILMDHHISCTQDTVHIPFFLRKRFHNAKRVYVLRTNRNTFYDARRILDSFTGVKGGRLVLASYS